MYICNLFCPHSKDKDDLCCYYCDIKYDCDNSCTDSPEECNNKSIVFAD